MFSPLIKELMESLRCLPGVGPKSAQKMALYLLERDSQGADRLANALRDALDKVGRCATCRTLTEDTECSICLDQARDGTRLCIVETPADVIAMENAGSFDGRYFVLLGHLSPIDGIGPEELGLDRLENLVRNTDVEEVIIATNSTIEGEATSHYISELLKPLNIELSRLAQGVPMGGELEYVDGNTLALALKGRKKL
ncbi:recombination mediator RecR [Marinomonas mediterranea]|uniref:Recombination protein RecR n=1 Tax=Marinomonas mediterranea (strain ATCC 700492 / JCM 21426 / NBRC 103028 / MMB-1) TaxID=717774 RepID=F2JU76_MARM1|nr:recombination mediator RecR [Marinomonas mediterranea]ADZ91588.1 Recombination protein recR [Marinomonas mediterranea MMB-1]WCN09550.1 recombination protein RecR [Marinomonas mediterranea]WCN13628.1 recombination protein RecR [Marinomonas mediterranea]WCN17691.1 recombination protein RecR [Marinomonas mediterranea MMB-1]